MLGRLLDRYDLSDGRKTVIKTFVYIFVMVILALLWNAFLLSPLMIVGQSMNPSLTEGDVVLVNKFSYAFGDVERFDIVVFPYKYDNSMKLVKRVIALPKEKVEIKDGVLYINDEEFKEYYGIYKERKDEEQSTVYVNWGPYTLAEDEVFVLGDNRNQSDDSRSSDVGPVKIDNIIGKVSFRIWPFNGIGSMKGQ